MIGDAFQDVTQIKFWIDVIPAPGFPRRYRRGLIEAT
jgi:hypothetical protein